ncbi:hypothetical protein THAOC_37602 [Thalassiosira oceanica]|uniref:Uncharacterized protein n=2 Tax=Thalassiosira oceanica TaxID=159749 RepID=K0RBL1_THAOC|nr:hypothetical protein THAOC_37602 [Thalassiosira oceanica]|eukprot:EJK43907.1 hypothetical protein THAOC_37602 [Thalassiosira oceanica]
MNNIRTRPPLQQRVDPVPHPSAPAGRRLAYCEAMRDLTMAIRAAGASNNPLVVHLRGMHLLPSQRSERRWAGLLQRLGHYRKCRPTGNNRATVLRDENLILIALYRIVFPKATAAEINAFLFRANYGNVAFRFYSPSQITEAEDRLGLTRKAGSTTAFQAMLEINRLKRWCYWNLAYPFGIADIRQQDLIDIDECGIELKSAEKTGGKAYLGERVNQEGLYSKTDKWNLLLAISGDPVNASRWRDVWTGEGTTGIRMITFIQTILAAIGPGTAARRYCFIMDNLSATCGSTMAASRTGPAWWGRSMLASATWPHSHHTSFTAATGGHRVD